VTAKFQPDWQQQAEEKDHSWEIQKADWEAQKQHRWEVRNLKSALLALGIESSQIKHMEYDLKEEFGWAWFNNQGYLPVRVSSNRILRFNFEALFFAKKNDPVLLAWLNAKDADPDIACGLIFRCYGFGGKNEPETFIITDYRLVDFEVRSIATDPSYMCVCWIGYRLFLYRLKDFLAYFAPEK